MLVGMEVDEESAPPPPPEEQSFFDDINRHCTLNTTQRLYGFAICLAAGLTCTFLILRVFGSTQDLYVDRSFYTPRVVKMVSLVHFCVIVAPWSLHLLHLDYALKKTEPPQYVVESCCLEVEMGITLS